MPHPPQQCGGTAECHTPGQAVTQPLATPGLGTEQGAWGHLLEKQLCHSDGYQTTGSDEKIHHVPSQSCYIRQYFAPPIPFSALENMQVSAC